MDVHDPESHHPARGDGTNSVPKRKVAASSCETAPVGKTLGAVSSEITQSVSQLCRGPPALTTFRLKGRLRCPRSTRVRRSKYSLSPQLSLPATHLLPKRSCSPSAQGDPRPEDNHTVLVCQPVENYRIPRNLLAVLRRLNPLFMNRCVYRLHARRRIMLRSGSSDAPLPLAHVGKWLYGTLISIHLEDDLN